MRKQTFIQAMVALMGLYLIIDGVASIAVFIDQPWYCHAVRIGRLLIGLVLLGYGQGYRYKSS